MAASRFSLRQRLLFGGILALLSVIVVLGLLEGGLRLAGYGHDARFFRVAHGADGTRWIRENRDFTLTYFPPALVRRPQPFRLAAKKPPQAYRIFILGSSAAMGDPDASFSLARVLALMLRTAYPEIDFEVVNAAITAINSHVVRDIAADCTELAPDLFIVYEGHNEVIGPFGPAAVLAPFLRSEMAIRASLAVKRTRTGQLLGALARHLGAGNDVPADWGGMEMFLEHEITMRDPRLDSVQARLVENLRAIADRAQSAGARVLLCTVLTNQKDFAPFLSRHRAGLDDAARVRWEEAFAAGNAAAAAGDWTQAEQHFRAAWAIDDEHAELAFRLGRICLAQGRDDEAGRFLQRALDADALRFRTDSRLNDAIRATAQALGDHVALVDLTTELAARCPHGIPGDELLYEHVHLTLRGTWEAAGVLFEHVSADLVRRGRIRSTVAMPLTYEETRRRIAFTAYEQAMIMHELARRFSRPPFTGQSDHDLRLNIWRERAAAADQLLQRSDASAALATLYEDAIAAAPDDWVLLRNYGMMLVARDAPAAAVPWLERACTIIDDDPDTVFALGTALREAGRKEEARGVFDRLRALESRYPELPPPASAAE